MTKDIKNTQNETKKTELKQGDTKKMETTEMEQKLWNAADELRGSMDASEYKSYLLRLIFYRFLSEQGVKVFAKKQGLDDKEYSEQKNAYVDFFESDDQAKKDDTIKYLLNENGVYVEPKSLFSTLVENINKGVFEVSQLNEAFQSIENSANNQDSKKIFNGIFDGIDLDNNRLGSNLRKRNQILGRTILLLSEINSSFYDVDKLGDAYEGLISAFSRGSGKKVGEFYTPHQVSDVVAQLVIGNDAKKGSVYDPTMGTASLLLNAAKRMENQENIEYYGQELNSMTYNLAKMNLLIHGVSYKQINLRNDDTLGEDWPADKKADAVVMNPPYSAKWDNSEERLSDSRFSEYGVLPPKSKADYALLLHGLYHLKEDGSMGIVLPHGVLFRGAKEGKIRQRLLEDNKIDAIIGLPANIFHSTSIPTLIMVLKKNKIAKDVMFIDASRNFTKEKRQNILTEDDVAKIVNTYRDRKDVAKYAHVASYDEIKKNDFNLNIPRYVDTFEPEPKRSNEELLKENDELKKQISENNKKVHEIVDQLEDRDVKKVLSKLINK